jgi:hypothetical protein
MNKFKMKTLCAAITGVGALGAMSVADAVYVNPNGLGQVLIYPYYTVNNKVANAAAFTSLLSVVNSTGSAKAVKVRFVEGRNSAEVLDFNLFLSHEDVWVAGIVQTGAGAGVYTPDTSCTVPKVSADPSNPTPFVNFVYAGDGAGDGLDRTREGYIEIIEMGTLTGTTAAVVTHVPGGGAPSCAGLDTSPASDQRVSNDIRNPNGGLFGGISLINVLAGEDFTADAVALDEFRTNTGGVYDPAGSIKPDLEDVFPPTAVVINGTQVITADAVLQNIDAVSAVLMHNTLMNEYVLDTNTLSATDWVVTAPTKRYYYDDDLNVDYLFQRNFVATGACDTYNFQIFDREEFSRLGGFSPPPPAGESPRLCWEATVVSFNGKNALGSNNRLDVNTTFQNGWARITPATGNYPATNNLPGAPFHVLPMSTGTFFGLPIIGFAVQTFNNRELTSSSGTGLVQSSYGGNFVHKYSISFSGN